MAADVRRQSDKMITRQGIIKIMIFTVMMILAYIVVYPFTPGVRHSHRLALARKHADLIRPSITNDPKFAGIQMGAYTGDNGKLWVVGTVASDDSLSKLHQLIERSKPPVETRWDVRVQSSPSESEETSNKGGL